MVVVFAANSAGFAVSDDFDHGDITRHGATVGGADGGGRAAASRHANHSWCSGASTTTALSAGCVPRCERPGPRRGCAGARSGVIGGPLPGYDHVVTDAERLREQLGVTLVPIAPAEVAAAYEAVGPERLQPLHAELIDRFRLGEGAVGESLERTLRASGRHRRPLRRLPARRRGDELPRERIPPRRARSASPRADGIGRMTSRGVPFTCVGDVMTAVAMVAVAALGQPTLYHELEALDYQSGRVRGGELGGARRPLLAAACAPHLAAERLVPRRRRTLQPVRRGRARPGTGDACQPDGGPPRAATTSSRRAAK